METKQAYKITNFGSLNSRLKTELAVEASGGSVLEIAEGTAKKY
jgi:hypothetical protein